MKTHLKIASLIFVSSAVASCATTQKTAKDELPTSSFAIKSCQNTQALMPDCIKASVAISVQNAEHGDYQKSVAQLKDLVKTSPQDASLYNNLGYVYYLSGDYKDAVIFFEKAIAIDSTNIRALNNIGSALNKLGQAESAVNFFTRAETIKIGKIRPVDNQTLYSKPVKADSEVKQQTQAELPLAQTAAIQKQLAGEIIIEKNSQTEIKKVSSGIYEVVKSEPPAEVLTNYLAKEPLPEVSVLAQSRGVSFKVHPMVNKLFNDSAIVLASNSELSNKLFTLEIVNGNGIKGFARKTGETLAEIGLNKTYLVANKKRYNQYTTVLQYKIGYREEAIKLAKSLNKMPVLVKFNMMFIDADMRLVLGRDVINRNYNEKYEATKLVEKV